MCRPGELASSRHEAALYARHLIPVPPEGYYPGYPAGYGAGGGYRPYRRDLSYLEAAAGPMAGVAAVVAGAGTWYLVHNLVAVLIAAAVVAAVVAGALRYADEIADVRDEIVRARKARAAKEWQHLTLDACGSASKMIDVDRRLEAMQRRLAALPGDLDGLAPVPFAAFRWQLAELLARRDSVDSALTELLDSAARVGDADIEDTAAPLRAELAELDAAYGKQVAALKEVETQLDRAEAAKRLAEASARAKQVAGASTAAVAATELWQPVEALADALRGLWAGYRDLPK